MGAAAWWVPRSDSAPALPPKRGARLPEIELAPVAAGPSAARPGTHRGFNLAHLHRRGRGYGSEASRAQLSRLRDIGVTHIALTPFGYVSSVRDVGIRWGGDLDPTLRDEDLLAEAAAARSLGLKVTLKPHIWSRAFWTAGKSRQDIDPRPDDGGWDAWFAAYTSFAVHYAKLAAQMDAALYVVGLEYLRATTGNPGAWADVAAACRAHYGGALTYAANWWEEAERFADWGAFDLIGVNAYAPLADQKHADPTEADLAAAWAPHLRTYGGLAKRFGKDVLFTEAGLPGVHGAAARPWDAGLSGDPDPALQARAYAALLSAAGPQPWFRGVYWWKWFTDDTTRERDAYCPMGQPAEDVLRRWWRG